MNIAIRLLILLASIYINAHAFDKAQLNERELAWIEEHSPVTYSQTSWEPIVLIKNGEVSGMIHDYLDLFSKKTGLEFVYEPKKSFKDVKESYLKGELDFLPGVSLGNQNENLTTTSYLNFPLVIVAKNSSGYISSLGQLQNKKIAVGNGFSSMSLLKKRYPHISLHPVPNVYEGLKAVANGGVDVFVGLAPIVAYSIRSSGLNSIKIAGVTKDELQIVINTKNEVLRDIFQKAIDATSIQEQNKIEGGYNDLNIQDRMDFTTLFEIAGAAIAVILGFVIWNRKLKQLVNAKTKELQEFNANLETIVEQRTKELENQKRYANSVLNTQKSIVISTDGKRLRSANTAFFDFFGVKSISQFLEEHGSCICDRFIVKDGYIQKKMGNLTWIEHIRNNRGVHKAIICQNDVLHIFTIDVDSFDFNDETLHVAVFSDITEMEKIRAEVEEVHRQTRSSIEYASLIQKAIIPEQSLFKSCFSEYFIIHEPKDIVGGDIYLFDSLGSKDEFLLMVIDCTGHGVPGAFVTMLVKAIEQEILSTLKNKKHSGVDVSPAWVLNHFNKTMKKLLRQDGSNSISNAGFDGGVLYYNKKERFIKYSGAQTPLFYIKDDELSTIKSDRNSIGYKNSGDELKFKEHTIDVRSGMSFYISSDGFYDQNGGEKGYPLGKKKLKELIYKNKNRSFVEQEVAFKDELLKYQGNEDRNDDITFIGFKL